MNWFVRIAGYLTLMVSALTICSEAKTLEDLTSVQIVGNVPFKIQLKAVKDLGVKNVRLAVRWNEVEKRIGNYDWAASDARIRLLIREHISPIITIFGGNNLYRNEYEIETRSPPLEGNALDRFAEFAAGVAGRYGNEVDGRPILYEIWNEPNTKTFWSLVPNPENYAKLAVAACEAIKRQDVNSKVIALAMEGTPVKTPYFVPSYNIDIYREWAGRAATPQLMACVDGISMHPYRRDPESYISDEPGLDDFVKAHWSKKERILIANTEWGYHIDGGDEKDQASRVLRALLVGAGFQRSTNLYQSVDTGSNATVPNETYGLVDRAGRIKPSGAALKRLLQFVGDHEVLGVGPIPGQPAVFRLSLQKGQRRSSVVWTSRGSSKIRLADIGFGWEVTMIDLLGDGQIVQSNGLLNISTDPILVTDLGISGNP